jgi:hypothetical protein
MVEPPIMDALRNKRSEVAGLVKDLEQHLVKHHASLSHLDATMRLFDTSLFDTNIDAGELAPNHQQAITTGLRHGECLRLIYDALRDAPQPLTTRELAERIMEMKSMPSTDAARRELIQKAILKSLRHAKGTITRIESKGVVSWQIHQAARARCQ